MKKAKKLTGEHTEKTDQAEKPTISLNQAVAKVNAGWRKQAKDMMEFAKLCKEARDAVPKIERKLLIQRVEMGRSVFNKICAIADNSFLQLPEVQSKLPGGYSLRWELTKMKEEDLRAALESGKIHPKVKREDIQKLLPKRPGKPRAKTTELRIRIDWSIPEYRKPSFQKWLHAGEDEFKSIKVNWDDLETQKALEADQETRTVVDEIVPVVPELDGEATTLEDLSANAEGVD